MLQKPLKVVHCSNRFGTLTENWMYNQVTGLDGILTKFYAVARENQHSFPFDNLRCLREDLSYFSLFFNRAWNKLFRRYPQFLLWLWRDAPNLIHAHFGQAGYYILPQAKWLGIPLITSFYGADAYKLPSEDASWRGRYQRLFREGRLFLAEGPAMRKKLIELGCPSEKVIVHHIGVKLEKYEFRVRQPDDQIRIMVCGRFIEKKGIPYAIEAFKRVVSDTKTDVRLTIVGDSNSNGTLTVEKRKILNAISEYKVGNAVTFTGFVPHSELLKIAYHHHILLAPSVHGSNGNAEGGFPVILTEALATGMPVVAFNHCDIPEIIQNGKSGFLVPERDVAALAEKLIYLIEHPEIWPNMGRAGRAHVEVNYDINKLNDRLVEIYQQLLHI